VNERWQIIQGNCLQVMRNMPDGCVQTCITSPPYWGLRSYSTTPQIWGGDQHCDHVWQEVHPAGYRSSDTNPGPLQPISTQNRTNLKSNVCTKCGAWRGELGNEDTPELYVQHMVEVFREVRRLLRDDGTLWLNLGPSYWGGKGKSGRELPHEAEERRAKGKTLQTGHNVPGYMDMRPADGKHPIFKPKDLVPIPWMVAMALQADGWWLRSTIIWHKTNAKPESVRDRPTRSHEYVFLLWQQVGCSRRKCMG